MSQKETNQPKKTRKKRFKNQTLIVTNREHKPASKSNSHNTSISSIRVGSTVYWLAPWIFKPEYRNHSNLGRVFLSFLFRSCTLELAKVTNKETIQRKKNIRGRNHLTKKSVMTTREQKPTTEGNPHNVSISQISRKSSPVDYMLDFETKDQSSFKSW